MVMARELRKNPTASEERLWAARRRRQVLGYRFRRQPLVLGFVLDFYCPALKLAIEADGSIHQDKGVATRDAARQELLEAIGIWFVRVPTADIESDVTAVVTRIAAAIHVRLASINPA